MLIKFIKISLFSLLLTSCASLPLQREQTAQIDREMSETELSSIIGKATVTKEYEINHASENYRVRLFKLQTGSRIEYRPVCTPICIIIPVTVPIVHDYAIIQKAASQSLLAWGTLEEISKNIETSKAPLIQKIKDNIIKDQEAYDEQQRKAVNSK